MVSVLVGLFLLGFASTLSAQTSFYQGKTVTIVVGTKARDEQHAADLEREFGSYGGKNVLR